MASLAFSSESPSVVEGPVHNGWLLKEGHDLRAALGMGGWKNRFFVLYYMEEREEYVLMYYKQEGNFERTEPQGTITLAGGSVAQVAKSPKMFFQFVVTTSEGKKYPMRSNTSEERAEWIERIGLATHFIHATDKLERPAEGTVDAGAFTAYGDKATVAKRATQFWGGDHRPFRDSDGNPIGDPQTTAEEEKLKTEIGAEDATAGALAETSLRLGVRLDFLLRLTFALGLWEWKTWEVWGCALLWRVCFSFFLL